MSQGSTISSLVYLRNADRVRPNRDLSQLKAIADTLEVLRDTTSQERGMSDQTAEELRECLALAEAALRRAYAELSLCETSHNTPRLQ